MVVTGSIPPITDVHNIDVDMAAGSASGADIGSDICQYREC